ATNQPNIILYDAHDDYGSQKWLVKKLTVSGREYTVFRSYFAQQYVLAFNGTANANGGRLYLKKLASTTAAAPAEAQFFVRDSAGGGNTKTGVARLVTRKSIEANDWHTLDGVGGATANNTQIQQYTQFTTVDASVNQLWVFEKGTTSTVNGRVTASVSAGTLQTWDLVDSGGHADWDGNLPTYQGLFETACATWNSKVGRTIFRKDSLINLQDFKIREAVRCPWVEFPEKTLAATYPNNPTYSSDQKSLIVSTELFGKVENNSDAQHLKTIMHELGHVLGLDHTNGRGNLLSQGAYAYKTSFGLDDLVCFAAAEQRY
ncbi:MAG: matrixin family metalloprotease, partial [Oscillospiraceae bacterium]|nr:matrixin family metalloprotease [Oscillospiraceae bacterium]